MAVKACGFQEAVKLLQEIKPALNSGQEEVQTPVDNTIPPIKETLNPTENPPFKATYEKYYKPHPWLTERGLKPDTLKTFEAGFYDNISRRSLYSGTVMLKIRRFSDSQPVGYISRNVGEITPDKPKYRFPAGLHKALELYGCWLLKEKAPMRVLYVVESPFAVMKYYQYGLPAVSSFGWSVSDAQLAILQQLTRGVIYLPDRDKELDALAIAAKLARHLWVKFPPLPDGIDDPEHLTLEQVRFLT
jgi:DNA primase